MTDAPLHYQTITEVAERIRSREISPVELTEARCWIASPRWMVS